MSNLQNLIFQLEVSSQSQHYCKWMLLWFFGRSCHVFCQIFFFFTFGFLNFASLLRSSSSFFVFLVLFWYLLIWFSILLRSIFPSFVFFLEISESALSPRQRVVLTQCLLAHLNPFSTLWGPSGWSLWSLSQMRKVTLERTSGTRKAPCFSRTMLEKRW